MRILVTGGAGFIGSHFIRLLLARRRHVELINFDKLTYAGNLENLADVAEDPRYHFLQGDIADARQVSEVMARGFSAVLNFAAETHVDRSIEDAAPFIRSNIVGTQTLLEAARKVKLPVFIHISTDEVYGTAPPDRSFREDVQLKPRSPYAASKAAADHLVYSYGVTFNLPAIVLRCTNNYGPCQFPEKLIPLMIANAREDKPLPVYGDGLQERDWLYVEDYCRAIALVLEKGKPGEIYNVSADAPTPNLKVVRTILQLLGKPESLIKYVQDRPGHDRRYALDSSKIKKALGWQPQVSFQEGIRRTIQWYQKNTAWLERTRSGQYRQYYERHYTRRAETFSSLTGPKS